MNNTPSRKTFSVSVITSCLECCKADSKHNYKVPPSGCFYEVSLLTLKLSLEKLLWVVKGYKFQL